MARNWYVNSKGNIVEADIKPKGYSQLPDPEFAFEKFGKRPMYMHTMDEKKRSWYVPVVLSKVADKWQWSHTGGPIYDDVVLAAKAAGNA